MIGLLTRYLMIHCRLLPDKALKSAKASFINWSKVDEFKEMWRKMH